MTILGAYPVLNCQSIESTLDFYQQLFQFVVINKRKTDNCLQWVHLMHSNTSLMLKKIEVPSAEKKHIRLAGISLYLYVDNINQLHHFIKAKNINITDVVLMNYQMYEFKIQDPEGNLVTVGQSKHQPLTE